MKQLGTHLILDAWDCPPAALDDVDLIRATLLEAIERGGATLIELCTHRFSPQGVTATATLAESHIAIHTWPEHGYFAADVFFCGEGDPAEALDHIRTALDAGDWQVTEVKRGIDRRARGAGLPG